MIDSTKPLPAYVTQGDHDIEGRVAAAIIRVGVTDWYRKWTEKEWEEGRKQARAAIKEYEAYRAEVLDT